VGRVTDPGSGRALIEVMEPANLRGCYDTPERGRVYFSGPGRVVVKRLMGPHRVVVGDVAMQEPAKMSLAQNHEVIQALAADGADHPLHERVLPGRSGGGRHLPDPHLGDAPGEDLAVDRVSITRIIGAPGLGHDA